MAGELEVVDGGECLVTFITCPNEESAKNLASELVGGQAAACVNMLGGVRSIYRWQGEICDDQEFLLVVKTRASKRAEVAEIVSQYHPYDEPELIFLPIQSGSKSYLKWLVDQTTVS